MLIVILNDQPFSKNYIPDLFVELNQFRIYSASLYHNIAGIQINPH